MVDIPSPLVKEVEAVLDAMRRTCCKCGDHVGPQPLTEFHASEKYPKGAQYMCKRCCTRYVRRRKEAAKKLQSSPGAITRTLHRWLGISATYAYTSDEIRKADIYALRRLTADVEAQTG